jgi:GxxExxY protein
VILQGSSADGLHADLTRRIIGAAYEVHKHLGHGFLERVYVTALMQELNLAGLACGSEVPIPVFYKGVEIGEYYADILVDGLVICEIKAVQRLLSEHEAQLMHYLKATGTRVGLLLNFGWTSVQVKRLVF